MIMSNIKARLRKAFEAARTNTDFEEFYNSLSESEKCNHDFQYDYTESYWCWCGRNNKEFYRARNYTCAKCGEDLLKEDHETCYSQDTHQLPHWAKMITKKIAGYED